jgi:hypothetical protein
MERLKRVRHRDKRSIDGLSRCTQSTQFPGLEGEDAWLPPFDQLPMSHSQNTSVEGLLFSNQALKETLPIAARFDRSPMKYASAALTYRALSPLTRLAQIVDYVPLPALVLPSVRPPCYTRRQRTLYFHRFPQATGLNFKETPRPADIKLRALRCSKLRVTGSLITGSLRTV